MIPKISLFLLMGIAVILLSQFSSAEYGDIILKPEGRKHEKGGG